MSLLANIRNLFRGSPPPKKSERAFAGAQATRLSFSMASSSPAINADLDGALVPLRARARSLAVNNENGRRFLSLAASNIVGPHGATLQVRAKMMNGKDLDKVANAAVEMHWHRWGKTADYGDRMTFPHLCRTIIKAVARDGEAIVRPVRNRAAAYGLQLQLLDADRLDETLNAVLQNGNIIRQGVEMTPGLKPVAYHIKVSHPGEMYQPRRSTTERVDARDCWHIYLPERAEQVRGYTWFHAVIMRLSQLGDFQQSAVLAAKIGASKIAALEKSDDAVMGGMESQADAKDAAGNLQFSSEPGEIFQLPAGYKLNSWDPQYPHENFQPFVDSCLRSIAMGFDVADHSLSGNMNGVNYSSARIAELSEKELWMMLQEWFIDSFVSKVYEDWLTSALLRGDITFPDSGKALPAEKFTKFLLASHFQGRRWKWVDPQKEAEGSAKLIEMKLTSRTEICASQGRDFADVLDELKAEDEAIKAAGLSPPPPPAPAAPPPPPDVKTIFEKGAIEVNNHAGATNVNAPITVPERVVEVKNENHVTVPERSVDVKNTVNNVTPQPLRKVTEIERDAHHEAVRTVETFEMSEPNG